MNAFLVFTGSIAVPLVTVIMGIILWCTPPVRNAFFGFRTKLSMSGDELWYTAQRYCGRLLTEVFAPLTVIMAAVSAVLLGKGLDSDGKFIALCVMIGVEVIALAAVNVAAELRLKKEGERHG